MLKNSLYKLTLAVLITMGISSETVVAQMYPVTLAERVSSSQVIIEGEVISKTSFWDAAHRNIYTSNIIEVYKVFKGSLAVAQVEIITEGGIVGTEMHKVSHSLQLKKGDVGVFTCITNGIKKENEGINSGYVSFRTYADKQGFLRYNLDKKTATDVFNDYSDITKDVYPAITQLTKTQFKTVKNVDMNK